MKIKVILFDLDGTLLPLNQETFVKTYFGLLAKNLSAYGYVPEKLVESIWIGTKAMILNNGNKTNEEVFWDKMSEIYGEDVRNDIDKFDEFYRQDFDKVRISCDFNELVPNVIKEIKQMGFRLALATNPIFPRIATEKRINWAGLNPNDFELFTTYKNSCHSKPNIEYYLDIIKKLKVKPEECLMVGNDVNEDMVANTIGINVFLLTDCLINKDNKDISSLPQGNFNELLNYIKELN